MKCSLAYRSLKYCKSNASRCVFIYLSSVSETTLHQTSQIQGSKKHIATSIPQLVYEAVCFNNTFNGCFTLSKITNRSSFFNVKDGYHLFI